MAAQDLEIESPNSTINFLNSCTTATITSLNASVVSLQNQLNLTISQLNDDNKNMTLLENQVALTSQLLVRSTQK